MLMVPLSYLTLILFCLINPSFSSYNSSHINHFTNNMPGKRNFSSFSSSLIHQQQEEEYQHSMGSSSTRISANKKLRRLPHVFSKVLELPFTSDSDVYIEDKQDCLKFIAKTTGAVVGGGIHVVDVYPGITKVIVRKRDTRPQVFIDELKLDVWRLRLPAASRPELATAVYARGQLVVTVPKSGSVEKNGNKGDFRRGEFKGDMGHVIAVQ